MLEHAEAAEFGGRPIRLPKRLNANSPPMLVLLVNEGTASTSDPLDALFAEALEAVASGQPMYWLRLERPQRVPSAPGGRVVKTHELNLINMCYLEDGKVVEGVTEFCMQVACEDMASPSSIFVELHGASTEVEAGVLAKVLASLQRLTLLISQRHSLHRYPVVVVVRQSVANAQLCALFTEYITHLAT